MKIVLIAGYTPSLINFRGDLIEKMNSMGFDVVAIGPEPGYEEELACLGARFCQIPIERTGYNPIKDLKLILNIYRLIKKEKPDVVFNYTIKPVIYGSMAAYFSGAKDIFSMVTGLGYTFTAKGLKPFILGMITKALYFISFKFNRKVFFQNPDDIEQFVSSKLINMNKCILVNGSGVNLQKFYPAIIPSEPVFLMICRLLKDKGVIEYLEAARAVKLKHPKAKFFLVGPFDSNPNSLKYEDIANYIDDGSVEYIGETKDVRPYISKCSTYVLPSYREGTPRTVLEAMAMGRAIITTDAPGCRETVLDGVNGFIIPVKDANALMEKMIWMIENVDNLGRMGQESLRICREKYDVKKVNAVIMNTMNLSINDYTMVNGENERNGALRIN